MFIVKSKTAGDKTAFNLVEKQILKKPSSLVGLAAGKTTDGLYKLISRAVVKSPDKWRRIKIFQIDEILGVGPKSPLSFNFEIKKELKDLIDILSPGNIFLIDGLKPPNKTIKKANSFIKNNGGIDLILLGIGPEYDPHIAYNTSRKSNINSRMRIVRLHKKVAKKLRDGGVPVTGITLGIKDILECKKVLLIAYGKEKAKSIKLALQGKINIKKVPASTLQLHRNLIVIIDKDAGKLLG